MGAMTPSSSLKSLFAGMTNEAIGGIGGGDNWSNRASKGDSCGGAFLRVARMLMRTRAVRLPWILPRTAPMEGPDSTAVGG